MLLRWTRADTVWEYGSGTPAGTPQHSTLLERELATRVRTMVRTRVRPGTSHYCSSVDGLDRATVDFQLLF